MRAGRREPGRSSPRSVTAVAEACGLEVPLELARPEANRLCAQWLEACTLERAPVDQHRTGLGVRAEKSGEIHRLAERAELLLAVSADVADRDPAVAEARPEA